MQRGTYDVKLCKGSKILMMEKKDIPFKWNQAPSLEPVEQESTLADVASGKIKVHNTVAVEVKIMKLEEKGTKMSAGKEINLKTAIIADSSSTMELNIWGEEETIKEGKRYRLKANVKSFNNAFSLSFKSKSAVELETEVSCLEGEVVEGELAGATIIRKYKCMKCRKLITLFGTISTCSHCGMRCKSKMLKGHFSGTITFNGIKLFTVQDDVMMAYLENAGITDLTPEEIEEHFMEKDKVTVGLLNKQSLTVISLK